MDVFALAASITLDTTEYENALGEASGKTHSFGEKLKSGLGAAAKAGAAAIGAATAAVGAFAASSVKVGAEFDSSMSQVAATMGTTVDQIGNLRDFAMEMGAQTAFSATEAADALNYMALAGYDADESMQALPNVLNLAAAGGIDLAAASDMVTDAQSALGLSMEESAALVDQMAMASSKSNTSVEQLGEAILTIGGTAKNLAGGTTELSTALGILADNGVKGAEGGTALRNIILSLSAPTDTAAKALADMGVQVYDAAGNMRPLNETFGDLQASLSTMTQGEQTQVLSEIFNKVDLKSVNALLANTGERFDELSGYIADASGAAEQMAATQLDNLSGDITLFKSALEGAQILLSDQLTPSLREFVQFGSESISTLSTAFQEGGLSGAMDALGTILSDGLNMVVEQVPAMIDAGMQLLGALGKGLIDNLPVISDSVLQIGTMLVSGLASALPDIGKAAIDIITTLADGIAEQLPELVPVAIDAILTLYETQTDPDNLGKMVDSALQLITSLADGLINALPKLMEKVPVIITNLVTAIVNNVPKLLQSGVKLIVKLGEGLIKAIPQLIRNIPQIIRAIVEGFLNLGSEILGIGRNIVSGIWNGIKEKIEWLKNKVKGFFGGILDGAKDFLGIKSPSKLFRQQVGQYIALGVAEGIEDKQDDAVKAADKLAKNVYSKSKDWAERQTKEQKLSLEEQLEVWEAIQSQFVKESKQYADAEKKVFELREQIQDEYYKKVESIHKDIDALESNYQNTLAERTQEIFNSYKLFDQIPERQKVSGDDLISNLQGQISTIEEFYSGLNELSARGIGESLIADIRKMGPSAVDELSALLALSDEKLSEYAGLYEEKQALANSVAVGELGELKKETDRKIRENLDALGKLYDTQAPDVGAAFTDGLAKGIQNGMSKVIQSAVSVAQAAVTAAQSALGGTSASAGFAGIADSMTSGLGSGLDSQLAEIQKTAAGGISFETADVKSPVPNMGAVLSAVMHGMNSISSMNSGMTIPITLEMDGDVLVQKTYRLYQNEASRVGPAMVRV